VQREGLFAFETGVFASKTEVFFFGIVFLGLTSLLSLYTILQCTMLCGVLREIGGSEGGRIVRNSIAIVLQPCGAMQVGGAIKR